MRVYWCNLCTFAAPSENTHQQQQQEETSDVLQHSTPSARGSGSTRVFPVLPLFMTPVREVLTRAHTYTHTCGVVYCCGRSTDTRMRLMECSHFTAMHANHFRTFSAREEITAAPAMCVCVFVCELWPPSGRL